MYFNDCMYGVGGFPLTEYRAWQIQSFWEDKYDKAGLNLLFLLCHQQTTFRK
jgi:hypothetical protein